MKAVIWLAPSYSLERGALRKQESVLTYASKAINDWDSLEVSWNEERDSDMDFFHI